MYLCNFFAIPLKIKIGLVCAAGKENRRFHAPDMHFNLRTWAESTSVCHLISILVPWTPRIQPR